MLVKCSNDYDKGIWRDLWEPCSVRGRVHLRRSDSGKISRGNAWAELGTLFGPLIQSTQHSREDVTPALQGYHSTRQLLQKNGEGGRSGEFHGQEPTATRYLPSEEFPGQKQCYMEYLVMKRVLPNSMDGNFGKSIVGMESESLSRVPVYSREKTDLPLPWWKCYQPAVRGQLVSLGSGTSRGLSDGLCCWQCGTQGGRSHSSLCEWTSTLLSPRITSILGAVAPLFKSPCDTAVATGREAVGRSRGPSGPSLMKLPFAKPSHETQIHSHSVSIGEVSPRASSHLVVTFPSVFLPNLWPSSPMDSHCSGKLWPYFLPGRMNNGMLYLKFCPLGGFP